MVIYDFIRGYQPFYPPNFVPFWVKENLEEVFLPTSAAMREGVIPRHAVIQAWTLDNWLATGGRIRSLAEEFVLNLKEAVAEGHVRIGASAYAHALLPLLSDELVEFSIRTGVESVSKHFNTQPSWFWFPDGAVDQRVLEILYRLYPDLVAIIPDGCVGKKNYSGFGWMEHPGHQSAPGSRQKVVIFNTLLKFLFLDSYMYDEKPAFVPKKVNFGLATKMAYDSKALTSVLRSLDNETEAILMREWENKTSRDGLARVKDKAVFERYPIMDVSSFVKSGKELRFELIQQHRHPERSEGSPGGSSSRANTGTQDDGDYNPWSNPAIFKISQIKPSCWEPFASEKDPYPLWTPATVNYLTENQKAVIESWRSFLDTCSSVLSKEPKQKYLPLLISDIPWNILAPAERKPDPMFIKRIIEEMFKELVTQIGNKKLGTELEQLYEAVNEYVGETYEAGEWKVR